jgi:hypothetical protein
MGLPKKVKKHINVYPGDELLKRRQELLDRIVDQDTILPESILHEDLDYGMLEFVKDHLLFTTDGGNRVNFIERILTIQRWAEMSNTFPFTDEDGNIELPFVVVIRKPEVPYGSNPSLLYTIPDRQTFFYRRVPTWNGNRLGADIYKIPQPIPVDMSFDVVVVCNRMRELNRFNKKVMQKFSSRQAYTSVKGHYIPMVLEGISDQSQIDTLEGRRYYQQVYSIQLQGFLIDEEEFEVTPAIDRNLVVLEPMSEGRGSSAVNIKKVIKNNVEVNTEQFLGDGNTTTFKTQRKINNLFYVELNGLVLVEGTDYLHNGNSSNIIFTTPPPLDSVIRVVYTYDTDFITVDGTYLVLHKDTFEFTDGLYEYNTTHPINEIVMLDVNGLLQLENDYYTYTVGETTITVDELPPSEVFSSKMSVVYLSKA